MSWTSRLGPRPFPKTLTDYAGGFNPDDYSSLYLGCHLCTRNSWSAHETAPASLCRIVSFIRTNWYQQFGAASHGYSGVGGARGQGGGQAASRRCERMIHGEETPQSLIHPYSWASIPKITDLWKSDLMLSADLFMPCSRAAFHPGLPPKLTEVHRDPARSLGSSRLWKVAPALQASPLCTLHW